MRKDEPGVKVTTGTNGIFKKVAAMIWVKIKLNNQSFYFLVKSSPICHVGSFNDTTVKDTTEKMTAKKDSKEEVAMASPEVA